jgi:choline dehydrogenase-like flavoprotein
MASGCAGQGRGLVSREPQADVLIIGSGASGAALSWRLSGHGAKVVCLEQGTWVDRSRLPKAHGDWEVRGRRYWAPNPTVRRWPADYPVASEGDDPIDVYMYNAVGGSQIGFAGNYWRFAPSDFKVKSLDGVGADWPLSYEDLAPYYTINEAEVGVAGLAGDPCGPERPPLPNPPAPLGRPGQLLVDAYEKLGWYWWPTEQSITTEAYRGRPACDNRGWCTFGCPQGSLSTADLTYWPGARKNGVELRTNSRVREIMLGPDGRAVGARYYDQDGVLREARAAVVVVACGGLGTPRLLKMSTSTAHPDGLANSSGLVGKNLMVHVQSFAVGHFNEPVDGWNGTWGGTVSTRQFYETDPARGYARGFIMSGCRGWSPLNLALQIAPWGSGHHAAFDERINHEISLYLCGEDLPEESNRVELDWGHLDDFGMPGVRTHHALNENSRSLGADMIAHGRQVLEAAGANSVRDFGLAPIWGWHLLGTARMGTDPDMSVTDSFNRAHDVPNLFIADASSMPSSGGVNPSSTIQALALRCADHIWEQRRDW